MGKLSEQKHNEQETQRRLDAILQGAFSGPPTPLKRIPKRNGGSRAKGRSASAASAKSAQPET
jgi:hypothetical protein